MKKLLGIVVLGLLWCNVGFAQDVCIEGNCQNGQGTYTWSYGDKYVGEYVDGKRHGQGTFTFADGEKYVGGFKNGKYHGQGTFTYTNGSVDKGIWENGKLVESN